MARTKRSAKLDSWNARKKLPLGDVSQEPLEPGKYLAYRRPKNGAAGSWLARWRKDTQILQKRLGTADDYSDADGLDVLTYAQAQEKAKAWFEAQAEQSRREVLGEVVSTAPFTVNEALDFYFEDAQRRGVKGVDRDRQSAGAWIRPVLGGLLVVDLTRSAIEKWHAGVAESPKRVRTSAKPAPKPRNFKVPRPPKRKPELPAPPRTEEEKRARRDTANRILSILKAALNHALDRRRVRNGEAWQTVKPFRGTTRARVRFLTLVEQVRLVNACEPDFRRLVQGALLSGARYSELTRLKKKDFNPVAGTIYISESKSGKPRHIVLTEEGQTHFRSLVEGKGALDLLFTRDHVQRRKRTTIGDSWGRNDQARLTQEASERAGIEPVSFHELRHSYASLLVNAGCPLAYVAAQLGHSDTRMVEKHYGHLAPSALAESVRRSMPKLGIV